MNNKTLSGMKCTLCLCGGLLVLGSNQLYAGEPKGKVAVPAISNVGFMKNPPKELKEKFPMCDAFLKVEWIDKEKKIGYSRYDFYKAGKKFKGPTWALVHLDKDYPTYDYNLEEYQKEGRLKQIFSFIRKGEVEFETSALVIRQNEPGKIIQEQFSWIHADWDEWNLTLADGRLTVCVPYPDNERMYLAEIKQVGKIYGKADLERKIKTIRSSISDWPGPPSPLADFGNFYALDLNADQVEDYFSYEFIVYSYQRQYDGVRLDKHEVATQQGIPPTRFEFTSPTLHKTCEVIALGNYYLTTDGANFYINNQCNFTSFLTRR